jgi:cellulose synthase/poly-beta-1,6-N-acetylglucosamine synthase-like glycosyltransferase/spore germination protein YaaH/peptidoglycan/xylan/chitin deacetylase (PgdA/CDA1 family)
MSERAVFFDPSRRRWSRIKRFGTLFGLVSAVIISVFLFSVFIATPLLPNFSLVKAVRRSLRRSLVLPPRGPKVQQFLLGKARKRLLDDTAQDQKAFAARAALPPIKAGNIVAAFYAPWQETGVNSLSSNASKMTHVLPIWVQLTENANSLDFHDWTMEQGLNPSNATVISIAREHNLNIVPVFSNATQGEFDPARVHLFLNDTRRQTVLIHQLRLWVEENKFQGINIDFENLQLTDYPLLVGFLQRVRNEFAPRHLIVSADLEALKPIDLRAAAALCDFVVVMIYDEHASGTVPGPISSINFFRRVLTAAVKAIPREKLVIGLANYAYDWTEESDFAEPLTYQQALVRVKENRPGEPPQRLIDFDPEALNPTYSYLDGEDKQHEVWMLDAVTAANEWRIAQAYSPRGVAMWALGMTDPTVWGLFDRAHFQQSPDVGTLKKIEYPYDVDYTGEGGEITTIAAQPTKGERSLEIEPRTHLVLDETYSVFPTSYLIRRSGYHPKMIALTIDDGPADPYTAQILDDLKAAHVKATFFLIGENAERYPNLVRRIWAEGHEIGNHSYTHPNIGTIPLQRARFELNATQRVFQALLHRSTILFRPPYNADAAPNSREEVKPIELATALNYITVLELLDPQDWNTEPRDNGTRHHRTAEEMLQSVLLQIDNEHGSCILLHDGGGDRSETVRLIPMLIKTLGARGYKFVAVSDLIGATRDQVNPPVTSADNLMLASDRVVFEAMYLFELFLSIAFISGIILGTLRVIFVTILALIERRREKHEHFDPTYQPSVSVVIAAFNEQKVIGRTIEAVLANGYPDLEIIVVDDGSKDDTSGEVMRRFPDRVRLLMQENGGKAAALNTGIAHARGEIIIALDADTIFERDTIRLLVRRFADPIVGAVAGNVKVGNRINTLTYWQAIEYVTSQNLDRRAYSIINSVTVVPGAVGAWRRAAVLQAGGYTTDTMAEDMDLTWRIRRIGWHVETDTSAIGHTEAPDSFRTLFKQRFRWAFGTLQSLWKHRRAVGRYGWFGRVMLPSLWLFQIAYQAISPLVDLQIIVSVSEVFSSWARTHYLKEWWTLPQALEELYLVAFMYAFFFVIELIGSLVAFQLDRENKKMLVWLFWQRFLYRQLMYAVLIKSMTIAMSGMRAGWGKLERKGTVKVDQVDLLPAPEPETP